MSDNDNSSASKHVITVERWDDPGDLGGAYLVSLSVIGSDQTVDARIFGDKDEAYDFARGLMGKYQGAIFHDQSEGDSI